MSRRFRIVPSLVDNNKRVYDLEKYMPEYSYSYSKDYFHEHWSFVSSFEFKSQAEFAIKHLSEPITYIEVE